MHKEYFIDKESVGPNTKDIFLNQFDITWAEGKTENKIFTKLPIEKIEDSQDDGSIIYKYNDDFFRCDNFKKTHEGIHILFAGCSQSEGVGGNIENSWTNILYNKIKENNRVDGFYSIAKAGYGWQKIISNSLIYFRKYGTPDYFFILLPNVGRMYEWEPLENKWLYKQKYPEIFIKTIKEKNEIGFSESEYMKSIIDFKSSWNLFEEFCNSKNIKMLWSTWDELDNINYKTIGTSDNYIEVANQKNMEIYFENYIKNNKLKNDDMNRRDDHYGTLYNRYWSDNYYKGARSRWEIR
jgi:hypothetical protein